MGGQYFRLLLLLIFVVTDHWERSIPTYLIPNETCERTSWCQCRLLKPNIIWIFNSNLGKLKSFANGTTWTTPSDDIGWKYSRITAHDLKMALCRYFLLNRQILYGMPPQNKDPPFFLAVPRWFFQETLTPETIFQGLFCYVGEQRKRGKQNCNFTLQWRDFDDMGRVLDLAMREMILQNPCFYANSALFTMVNMKLMKIKIKALPASHCASLWKP